VLLSIVCALHEGEWTLDEVRGTLQIVLTLLSLILFIGGQTVGGIVFLVLAFLVSPFGVPATAEWLVDKLHSAKFALRDFITG